jgi:[acyl-carrier-protein] S-malonyltransferase
VAYSFFLWKKLEQIFPEEFDRSRITHVLGHSVGEYSALTVAGSMSFANTIKAVHERGKAMQQAVPLGEGSMLAVLKVPLPILKEGIQAVHTQYPQGVLQMANFNSPTQIVVAGHTKSCEILKEWLQKNVETKHRVVTLPVSAPFHCSLMKPAVDHMEHVLSSFTLQPNQMGYIANIDGVYYPPGTSPDIIKHNLLKQICESVLWSPSIENHHTSHDQTYYLEIGPGQVLKNLQKQIISDSISTDSDHEYLEDHLKSFLQSHNGL